MNGELIFNRQGVVEPFHEYVPSIEKSLERMIVFEMIKTGMSLDEVIEGVISGRERTFRRHVAS